MDNVTTQEFAERDGCFQRCTECLDIYTAMLLSMTIRIPAIPSSALGS